MDLGVKEEDLQSPEVVQINRLYSVPEVIMDADVIRESQLSLMVNNKAFSSFLFYNRTH